jgi:small subunit ribosomal protein S16
VLKIRLSRKGSNNKPFYRVVVSDSRRTPTARVVETIGYYDPTKSPAKVEISVDRAEHWMGKGAHASETVRSLVSRLKKAAPAAS